MTHRLTVQDLIDIRERRQNATKEPWFDVRANSSSDILKLLAEVERLRESMKEISEIVSGFYTEQEGIRLPLNLSPIAGELQVIHKIAGGV